MNTPSIVSVNLHIQMMIIKFLMLLEIEKIKTQCASSL